MTLALNKMAVWFATVMVAGLMLLVSSAAEAHVAHGVETVGTPAAFETSETQAVYSDRSVRAAERSVQDADVRISEGGTRTEDDRQKVETSCCGTAVSSCSSAILVQAAPALRLHAVIMTDASLGSPSLTGTTIDGLIRPPRAAV